MGTQKVTFHTTHPTTGIPVMLETYDSDARWALWSGLCDGRGLRHFGFSPREGSTEALRDAWVKAPGSTRHAITPLAPVAVLSV